MKKGVLILLDLKLRIKLCSASSLLSHTLNADDGNVYTTVCPKNFLTFERPVKGLFNGLWVLNLVPLEFSNTAFLRGKIIFIGVH